MSRDRNVARNLQSKYYAAYIDNEFISQSQIIIFNSIALKCKLCIEKKKYSDWNKSVFLPP